MAGGRMPFLVMAPFAVALAGYGLIEGAAREHAYNALGVLAMAVAFAGLRRHHVGRGTGWLLALVGFAGWVVGDLLFWLMPRIGVDAYPSPADAVYIAAYGVIGAGLLRMARRRGGRGDVPAILDALILATGTAVVAGVFVLAPIAADSTLTLAGKLTSALYPLGDVLLIGILARLWTTPGARTISFRLLALALVSTMVADTIYTYTSITGGTLGSSAFNDVLWLAGYVLVAGATWSPSVAELSEPPPGREELADPRTRLIVLTGGLLLPGITLMVDGIASHEVEVVWPVIAGGSIVLSLLVLGRMAGLLNIVQAQAVQLAALARSDPLTGVPNRRTWDHELSRACRLAREDQVPLVVALIDLDNFKAYNDAFGHLAGDRLLREATAAWSEELRPGEMLARYGGEEFSLLFPGRRAGEVVERLQAMLARTPHGQTFSAGVATWDTASLPSAALADADGAMYAAKRAGRNRIFVAPQRSAAHLAFSLSVALQPIVDLTTRKVVAVEALARFPDDDDPATVFRHAHESGYGAELEAAAISAP